MEKPHQFERIGEDHPDYQRYRINRPRSLADSFSAREKAELRTYRGNEELRQSILGRVRDNLRPLWTHEQDFVLDKIAEYDIPVPEGLTGVEGPDLVDAISDDELQEWLERYEQQFEKTAEGHRERFERYYTEFLDAAEEAIDDGWLPLTKEELYERVGWVNPMVMSGLAAAVFLRAEGTYGIGGYYGDHNEDIAVVDDVRESLQRHYFFHEMVHHLAGRTTLAYRGRKHRPEEFLPFHQRGGLHFRIGMPDEVPRMDKRLPRDRIYRPLPAHQERTEVRLRWLDEATTEEIAVRLDGGNDYRIYSAERRLKQDLKESGRFKIPERLFLEAYFENHPGRAGGATPKWKRLRRLVDEAHGKGFLFELDDTVRFEEYKMRHRALEGAKVTGDSGVRLGRRLIRKNRFDRLPDPTWKDRADHIWREQIFGNHGEALLEIGRLYDFSAEDMANVLSVKKRTVQRWVRHGVRGRYDWRGRRIDTLRIGISMLEGSGVPPGEVRDVVRETPELAAAIREDSIDDLQDAILRVVTRRLAD